MGKLNRSMGKSSVAAKGAAGGFGAMAGRLVPVAAVAAAAGLALRAVARAAVGAGMAVADAALYMDGMRYSLSKFLGSAKAGNREMAKLLDVSDDLGISFKNAAGTFKSFVSAGLTADAAHEMVKFRADLEAVANTEKDLERLQEAFMQIEKAVATGRLEMDGFTSILAGLPGVTEESIFAKLAPMMGKTVDELKKLEKTKLPVDKLPPAQRSWARWPWRSNSRLLAAHSRHSRTSPVTRCCGWAMKSRQC
jgi:tape measure domain-containing protein